MLSALMTKTCIDVQEDDISESRKHKGKCDSMNCLCYEQVMDQNGSLNARDGLV